MNLQEAGFKPLAKSARSQHPLSACFPPMQDMDYKALVDDIGNNGQLLPITLFEDQVLDGWHRLRACIECEIHPDFVEYEGDDPVAFVKSMNWNRRHLNASQRGVAILALREWRPVGANQHQKSNSAPGAELHQKRGSAPGADPQLSASGGSAPGADPQLSSSEMAKEAGVGTRTIERSKAVVAHGIDELKTAVKEGKISVKVAEKIAQLPKGEQKAALEKELQPKPPRVKDKKKNTPPPPGTIEQVKFDALAAEFDEMASNYEVMADQVKTCDALASEPGKAMILLREEIRSLKIRRDSLMDENAELKTQVNIWRKRAEKAEKKLAK